MSHDSSGRLPILASGLCPPLFSPGQIALEHLKIFAREWGDVMVAADQAGRLQASGSGRTCDEVPIDDWCRAGRRLGGSNPLRLLIPPAVKPDAADLAVLAAQAARSVGRPCSRGTVRNRRLPAGRR